MISMNRRQFLFSTVFLPIALRLRQSSQYAGRARPPLPAGTPTGFGVGMPWQNAETVPDWYDSGLALLQPAWWHNWKFDRIGMPGYVPMMWKPEPGARFDEAVAAANANPNAMWFFLNSPDRGAETAISPATAAVLAQTWTDSTTSSVSMPGVASSSQGVAWLKAYLDAGGPIPDVWHFHLYGRSDGDSWLDEVNGAFSDWYLAEGGNRPVIISETNAGMTDFAHQRSVMDEALAVLAENTPLVAIGWYSDHDPFGTLSAANLRTRSGTLTPLGQYFAGLDKTP